MKKKLCRAPHLGYSANKKISHLTHPSHLPFTPSLLSPSPRLSVTSLTLSSPSLLSTEGTAARAHQGCFTGVVEGWPGIAGVARRRGFVGGEWRGVVELPLTLAVPGSMAWHGAASLPH